MEGELRSLHPNIKRSTTFNNRKFLLFIIWYIFAYWSLGVCNETSSGRSISRILSSTLLRLCDHLSGRRVAAPLGAAYPGLALSPRERARMKTSSLPSSADDFVPAWPCSWRGLPGHPHYCGCRWSFTPPFHHHLPHPSPLPKGEGLGMRVGCLFLWPFYPAS